VKKHIILTCTLAVLASPVFAQVTSDYEDCDPSVEDCGPVRASDAYKEIYPFKPMATKEVVSRVSRLSESREYISDIREINRRNLLKANTKNQPWGGSFWPLIQGQVANDYQNKNFSVFHGALSGLEVTSWRYNYNKFQKRREKMHPKVMELSEKELAELAPSEKYDLLLGDTSFDLTNRAWNYAASWGEKKKWGFLSSIDLPAGYRIPEASKLMALWEGICHGWAVAAGHTDRPEKTVWVTLPNNKKMPFYPNDIKALISLMWANSTIQDAVIVEGLRCNRKSPKKDDFGRYIDKQLDKDDKSLLPRCADVHPAVYHTSVVNILGIEGRSFVVDKSAKAAISNQPVSGYEYNYFNPETGKDEAFENAVVAVEKYAKDPFKDARNPETKYIVGVHMILKYIDWEDPIMKETNSPADDSVSEMKFNYDLELDANFKIIGGQWRVDKNGSGRLVKNATGQPDFFWVVPRDYKQYFKPIAGLPEWNFSRSTLPPAEFKAAARVAHSFVYQETREYGWNQKCTVLPIKRGNGEVKKVPCEYKVPRPQPLINVVNKLLEESRR
jgi:hypothetical protein